MACSTALTVGFPGESEADFKETLSLVEEAAFDQVYAFAFSPRPGTPAARALEMVPETVQSERLQVLLALQEKIQARRNADLVGREFEILVDGLSRLDEASLKGRTTCNRIVHVPVGTPSRHGFARVRITRAHAHSLTGEPAEDASAA